MNFRTSRVRIVTAVVLAATAVTVPDASMANDASGPRTFDPVDCLGDTGATISFGIIAHCLIPEPHEGPASGIPGNTQFEPDPGAEYSVMYGTDPEPLPTPDDCTTPARASWTHDQVLLTEISERKGKTVVSAVVTVTFMSGMGEGGRSTLPLEFWLSDDQQHVVLAGRELFEGTIAGRTGSMMVWNSGLIDRDGRANGRAFSYGAGEGLKNIRFEANFTVMGWKGGHWVDPSRVCFVD